MPVRRLDSVSAHIICSNGCCIKALLIHDDGLLCDIFTILKLLDYISDIRSLEWITLSIVCLLYTSPSPRD